MAGAVDWRIAPGCPCSWARRTLRSIAGRLNAHPLLRWRFIAAQGRPPADRAAGPAHRRPDPRERNLCRPLRLRRQGRDLRRPLAVRDRAAVGGMGRQLLGFGWLRHLRAAESGITRANARALVDEWITAARRVGIAIAWQPDMVARRIISWLCQAPLVLHDADDAILSPLPAQPDAPGALSAPHRDRQRATACRACRRWSRSPMRRCAWQGQARTAQARSRSWSPTTRAPDPARRRTCQPQSRRADRAAARPAAAAPGLRGAQHRAAAAAQQRDRPHDADAALLPARRRQFRAVQRHGADAARPARDRARL